MGALQATNQPTTTSTEYDCEETLQQSILHSCAQIRDALSHTNQSTEASDAESYHNIFLINGFVEHFGTVESIWSEDFRSITKKLASAMLKTLGPHHTHKADRMPEANWLHHPGQGTVVTDSSWLRDDCKIFLKELSLN